MKKILHKLVAVVLTLSTLALAITLPAVAQPEIQLVVDGVPVVFTDAYPMVDNGRTLVPVRALSEAMNATVDYDSETNTVTLTKGDFSLVLRIGNYKSYFKNGKETVTKGMDSKAVIINGRTYLPARYVGYGLGYSVEWKSPTVYYTFINKQTTDFEIDANVKYPNKYPHYSQTFSYYNGYGDVMVANGDDGDVVPDIKEDGTIRKNVYGQIVYRFDGNAFDYKFSPFYMIFDSDELNIDLVNKTPDENLNNFKEVFEDIAREKAEQEISDNSNVLYLSYNTVDNVTNVSYDANRRIFGLDKYNKYKWVICNTMVMTDFSNYLFSSDYNEYIRGTAHQSIAYDGGSKNTLMLLSSFLGEDGQKIWQMLHDYHNNCGKQYVAPETYWPYPEMAKPPIGKEIVEMYDLKFVEYETDGNGFQYTTIFCPTAKREVALKLLPIGPTHAYVGYTILF